MGVNRLPAATFDYTVCNPPAVLDAGAALIGGLNEPSTVMDSQFVDLLDLNGDGLPDVLRTYEFGGGHVGYLNLGETRTEGQRRIQWSPPKDIEGDPQASLFWLSQASVHLADMDGDGLADLVAKTADEQVQFYPNQGNVDMRCPKAYGHRVGASPAPFGELNVRTADLDFDKRIDLIRGDGSGYQVWFDLGGLGLRAGQRGHRRTYDLGLPGVHVADLNGDRVPDITRVRTDRVEFTAGLGYGRFTATRSIPIPDINFDEQQANRCVLADITGDGLPDLVLERAATGSPLVLDQSRE